MDQLGNLLLLAVCGFVSANAKPLSCLVCKSYADQACGLNFTRSGLVLEVQCNVGHCFTYVTVDDGGRPMVTRGCGGINCDFFPGASGVVCDGNNILAPPDTATGPLFNKKRTFSQPYAPGAPPTEATIQYCNSGPKCNSGLISAFKIKDYYYLTDFSALGDSAATAPAKITSNVNNEPPTSCFTCKSYVDQACGLKREGGVPVMEVNCSTGYCFTYVRAEAGTAPMVIRGCGGISCNQIPGASGSSVLCDENNVLVPPDTANGQLFNQSRSFSQPFAPGQATAAATIQYCNNGPKCNSLPVSGFKLKDYYYPEDLGETAANITANNKPPAVISSKLPAQPSSPRKPTPGGSGKAVSISGTSNKTVNG